MSRCFPFPPPGFAGKSSSNEALILSIKPQSEKEANLNRESLKAKSSDKKPSDRKDKREKKEKKKEGQKSVSVNNEKLKLISKLLEVDKSRFEPKGKSILLKDDSQILERSSVTEESGLPVNSHNVSCSTDSTGNSSKRRRPSAPSAPPSGIQASGGSKLRIRLPSLSRRDEPSTSGNKEEEIGVPFPRKSVPAQPHSKFSVATGTESFTRQNDVAPKFSRDMSHYASTSKTATQEQGASRQVKEVPCLPAKKVESVPLQKKLSSHEKKMRKKESKYKKLFENWVPPQVQFDLVVGEDEDEDWLFGGKGGERESKRLRLDVESSGATPPTLPSCASAALQPRAEFLPDVGVYALPFTVPY